LLATLIDVAGRVGYPVLFVLIAIETMGIPVPGETALITAGILAGRGDLDIGLVIVLAAAAAILGDNVGFAIGRKVGRRLLTAQGPLQRHRARVIEVGEPFFQRHGPKAVFLGRWVTGLRITAAWLAGVNRMRWPIFLFWNALGGIAWATSVALLSYFLGHTAKRLIELFGLAGAGLVVVGGVGIWIVLRRRRERPAAAVGKEIPTPDVARAREDPPHEPARGPDRD
jgi:membrane-associated protein